MLRELAPLLLTLLAVSVFLLHQSIVTVGRQCHVRRVVLLGDSNQRWLYHLMVYLLSDGRVMDGSYGHRNFSCRVAPTLQLDFIWLPEMCNLTALPPMVTDVIVNTGHWNFKVLNESGFGPFLDQYFHRLKALVQGQPFAPRVVYLASLAVQDAVLPAHKRRWLYAERVELWNNLTQSLAEAAGYDRYDAYGLTRPLASASPDGVHYSIPSPWTGPYLHMAQDLIRFLGLPCDFPNPAANVSIAPSREQHSMVARLTRRFSPWRTRPRGQCLA